VKAFADKNFLRRFDSLEECRRFLGGDPILSKLAMITKTKNGRLKRRLVLDSKRSRVVQVSAMPERVLLPRITDAITDHLDLMALCTHFESVEFFILDFLDAFWQLPSKHSERRFFVVRVDGSYFVYMRSAQGSKNAPLTWARFIALVCRLTQSLFSADEVRLRCYVDDPCVSVKGTPAARDTLIAICILVWRSLGLGLAFSKGERGTQVEWIGVQLFSNREFLQVSLKRTFLDELRELITVTASSNVVSLKQLRTLAGKANRVATIVYTWRPFLSELWAAIADCLSKDRQSNAP
jgi:hypothetical protein